MIYKYYIICCLVNNIILHFCVKIQTIPKAAKIGVWNVKRCKANQFHIKITKYFMYTSFQVTLGCELYTKSVINTYGLV